MSRRVRPPARPNVPLLNPCHLARTPIRQGLCVTDRLESGLIQLPGMEQDLIPTGGRGVFAVGIQDDARQHEQRNLSVRAARVGNFVPRQKDLLAAGCRAFDLDVEFSVSLRTGQVVEGDGAHVLDVPTIRFESLDRPRYGEHLDRPALRRRLSPSLSPRWPAPGELHHDVDRVFDLRWFTPRTSQS
jgi:hypothetical protein